MNFGFVLLGSAAAGAIGGFGAAAGVHARVWNLRLNDAWALEHGQPLPSMVEPPAKARKPRSIVLNYVLTILGSGFAVWLIAFVLLLILADLGASATSESVTVFERVVPALIFAAIFGGFGFLVPGAFLAVILHFVENKARLNADETSLTRQYWEEREQLCIGLQTGQISLSEAINLLRGDAAPAFEQHDMTYTSIPLPEANAPITPKGVFAVAAAVARHGYVGVDAGMTSTVARVIRILTSAEASERSYTDVLPADITEADDAFVWAMHAYEVTPRDDFRERVGDVAVRETIDPQDRESIRTLAAGIGAYRRAKVMGHY